MLADRRRSRDEHRRLMSDDALLTRRRGCYFTTRANQLQEIKLQGGPAKLGTAYYWRTSRTDAIAGLKCCDQYGVVLGYCTPQVAKLSNRCLADWAWLCCTWDTIYIGWCAAASIVHLDRLTKYMVFQTTKLGTS